MTPDGPPVAAGESVGTRIAREWAGPSRIVAGCDSRLDPVNERDLAARIDAAQSDLRAHLTAAQRERDAARAGWREARDVGQRIAAERDTLRAQVTAAQGATVDEANRHAETFRRWHGAQAKLAAIRAVVEPIARDLVPARHLAARILAQTTGPGEGQAR